MADIPLPRLLADAEPGGYIYNHYNRIKQNDLKNALLELENQYYGPKAEADIGHKNALTNQLNTLTPLEAEKLRLYNQFYGPDIQSLISNRNALTSRYNIENQFLPEMQRADIESKKALSSLRALGGSGMGTGGKEELMFQNFVSADNPHIPKDKIYEAANVLRMGGNQLSDGTRINPLSPAAKSSLDRIMKGTTTSALLTGNLRAQQAETELDVLSDYAQKGLAPYGNTLAGYSPQQIVDSFKSDDASQERLGRFIASQQLQFEIAQNEIKLAQGQPGVTTTNELMEMGQQGIKTKYPKLSYKARSAANKYFMDALKAGNRARQSVNIGASSATKREGSEGSSSATLRYNQSTGEFERI